MRTFVNVHGGISYPDSGRKVVGYFYSGYHTEFDGESEENNRFALGAICFLPNTAPR